MFRLSNLAKPTPKCWRRLGNALVGISSGVAVPVFLAEHKGLAAVLFVAGLVGKFITSMTSENSDV